GDAAQAVLGLTELHVVTAHFPPHRPPPETSSYHRFAMVALTTIERPAWRASDLELRHESPSYTSRTLHKFHDRGYQPTQLFFVIGSDAFADIATWRDYPTLLESAHFAVVSRPHLPAAAVVERLPGLAGRMVTEIDQALSSTVPLIFLIDAPTADVSSTAIRSRLATGAPIDGMVAPRVQQHIEQHGLYRSMTPGRRAIDADAQASAGRLHGQD
ncbi:MAG TPA: nicotinate-nucleotide adenylyltransferase, partial [Vicinamibacterales bacterium]|nr:nicotinate-nucleotide adenylyltransferase [Vicinamibacterales bacterium]